MRELLQRNGLDGQSSRGAKLFHSLPARGRCHQPPAEEWLRLREHAGQRGGKRRRRARFAKSASEHRRVYSVRCEADGVMTSVTRLLPVTRPESGTQLPERTTGPPAARKRTPGHHWVVRPDDPPARESLPFWSDNPSSRDTNDAAISPVLEDKVITYR